MTEIDTTKLKELGHLEAVAEQASRRYARAEADKRLRKYRNQALVGFLLLVIAVAYSFYDAAQRSYKARGVVCQIIKQGDYQAYQYHKEGTISTLQLKRSLDQSVHYRKLLAPSDKCDTNFTEPPNMTSPGPATTQAPRQ